MADWDNPYITCNMTLKHKKFASLEKCIKKGYIYKGLEASLLVHGSSESTLAEAEVGIP